MDCTGVSNRWMVWCVGGSVVGKGEAGIGGRSDPRWRRVYLVPYHVMEKPNESTQIDGYSNLAASVKERDLASGTDASAWMKATSNRLAEFRPK